VRRVVAAAIHTAFKFAGIGPETSMSRSVPKLAFLVVCAAAMVGWVWLIEIAVVWLVS
jgi:hypothetical protein